MRFAVYGHNWAYGLAMTPKQILEKYCSDKPIETKDEDPRAATFYLIDISPEEMMKMMESKEFDILISGNYEPRLLAFDAIGKKFRQR